MIKGDRNLFSIIFTVILLITGCKGIRNDRIGHLPAEPDYGKDSSWFVYPAYGDSDTAVANVFYIAPTCIWDWEDSTGGKCHFMDISNEKQRRLVTNNSLFLASMLLGKDCDFYAPYYRQLTMDTWMEDEETISERFYYAMDDVCRAFEYFIVHINNGHPFIIAGHSQGAKCVIELLKRCFNDEIYKNLVAAYVFGYPVTGEDMANSRFIRPAEGPSDIGKVIAYNSVSRPEAVSAMFSDNAACINPINWKTDTTYAPASMNAGSVFFKPDRTSDTLFRQVGARIDKRLESLVIDGLDDDKYFIESVSSIFPKGNYHIQELNLYFINIQENLRERVNGIMHRTSNQICNLQKLSIPL